MEDSNRYAASPAAVFRELDGEMVLLNLDTGVYFGLDPVGTRVWGLLVEHGAVGPVCAQMVREFDVTADVVETDVRRLVGELLDKGLLAPAAAPARVP